MIVVVHVDDFLCTGDGKALEELHVKLSKAFEIKQKTLSMEDYREVSYLNRILKVNSEGINIIGDPKHSKSLLKEWGIQEYSKEVYTPSLKELEDQAGTGEELVGDVATKVRRGGVTESTTCRKIDPICPQLPRSCPNTCQSHEKESCIFSSDVCATSRSTRSWLLLYPGESLKTSVIWWLGLTSDWAGDVNARRSTSGATHHLQVHSPDALVQNAGQRRVVEC